MNENIASRVGRLIAGSVNAIVDAMENSAPETVMAEAIREVETAIDEVRAELGKEIAGKHLANQRLAGEKQKLETLNAQAEVAVTQGRDDLAQAAIARILNIEAQLPILEQSISDRSGREKELEGYVQALRGRKSEMEEELDRFRQSRREAETVAAGSQTGDSASGGVAAQVEQATDTFGRVLKSHTRLGMGQAAIDSQEAAKLAELEDITRKHRLDERLAQMKARAKVQGSA